MKKALAVIMTAAMLLTVFVFNASAASNEWVPYGKVDTYKDSYDSESEMPMVAGMRYTDYGVQMYTPTSEQLETWGKTAYCSMQLKDKINFENGFSMTMTVDEFTDKGVDKWISINVWTDEKPTPEAGGYGKGWLCLLRPGGTAFAAMSFIDVASNLVHQHIVDCNIYQQEAITFEIKKIDGKYTLLINDTDMMAYEFIDRFEDHTAYIGVCCHQGNYEPISLTVNDVNGVMPTGTESYDPFVPSDITPRIDPPEIPAGDPVFLLNYESFKSSEWNAGMKTSLTDEGNIHVEFTDVDSPIIMRESRKYNYSADEYPVWAILFKNIDEIADSGVLYFFAGEVKAPQEGSMCGVNWLEGDYDEDNDTGWRILTIDLSQSSMWNGIINGYRLTIGDKNDLAGQSADIKWIGNFKTVEEAYTYAGMKDLYDKNMAPPTPPTAADTDTEPAENDTTDQTTENAGTSDVTKNDNAKKGTDTGLIIGIIAAIIVVAAVICAVIVIRKKKK